MSEPEKPKNYYSLNLTEGRIFIIFITILVVIALFIFTVAFFMSNKKHKDLTNTNQQTTAQNQKNEIASNLYDTTSNSIMNNNPLSVNSSSSSSPSSDVDNNAPSGHEKNEINRDSGNVQAKLDNSEVLYSSKFINGNEKEPYGKKDRKLKGNSGYHNDKKETKAPAKSYKKSTASQKQLRYIIQIGSYVNRKLADDISSYYEKQGYPTFIREKENKGKTFYRLRIGPFKEKETANTLMANLKNTKYGKDCYISIIYL